MPGRREDVDPKSGYQLVRQAAATVLILLLGACTGWVADQFGVPLAWMVGPFICIGAATLAYDLPKIPAFFRYLGQLIAGGAIGLYLSRRDGAARRQHR